MRAGKVGRHIGKLGWLRCQAEECVKLHLPVLLLPAAFLLPSCLLPEVNEAADGDRGQGYPLVSERILRVTRMHRPRGIIECFTLWYHGLLSSTMLAHQEYLHKLRASLTVREAGLCVNISYHGLLSSTVVVATRPPRHAQLLWVQWAAPPTCMCAWSKNWNMNDQS